MLHLPVEIWDHVFSYLLPQEVIGWVSGRVLAKRYLDLHFAADEKPDQVQAIKALAYTADLFYKHCRDEYWRLLVKHARWTIGADWDVKDGYIGTTDTVSKLKRVFGSYPQHLALIIDSTRDAGGSMSVWTRNDRDRVDVMEVALHAFREVMSRKEWRSLHICVDMYSEVPKEGDWVSDHTMNWFFRETIFNEHEQLFKNIVTGYDKHGKVITVPWTFKSYMDEGKEFGEDICVYARTSQGVSMARRKYLNLPDEIKQSFKPVFVEDVTKLWDELPAFKDLDTDDVDHFYAHRAVYCHDVLQAKQHTALIVEASI